MSLHESSGIVLMYHRVVDYSTNPHGTKIRPSTFEAHLRCIREIAAVNPLASTIAATRLPCVSVTLDDGYVDNLVVAKPILDELSLPATVFVTSGMIGRTDGFWWDRLSSILEHEPPRRHLEVEIGGRDLVIDLGSPLARQRAYRYLQRLLLPLTTVEIDRIILAMAESLDCTPSVSAASLPMTARQVVELARGGGVAIGSHTVTHTRLSSLDAPSQQFELEESRRTLEELLDSPVSLFAYPFGDPAAIDAESVRIASQAYDLAVTTVEGRVAGSRSIHEVRRFEVLDWSVDEFESRFRQWLNFPMQRRRRGHHA